MNMNKVVQDLEKQIHCEIRILNEGWSIFNADGVDQIQKIDEDEIFLNDESAIRFVLRKAIQNPIGIHSLAIMLVSKGNKEELELINKIYEDDKL